MRYLFLLIALVIFAALVTLYFTSPASIFSGKSRAGQIRDVEPAVEKMNEGIEKYNKTFESVQQEADEITR